MPEPSVQVPVSLIEQMQRYFRSGSDMLSRRMAAELTALLSQPTPTAEPERAWVAAVLRRAGCTFSDDGPVDELFDLFAGRTVMAETSDGRMPLADALAAPPSIDDMAPGTTFYAVLIGTGRFEQWMRVNSCHPVARMRDGLHADTNALDPSTIRDVTPPAVTE